MDLEVHDECINKKLKTEKIELDENLEKTFKKPDRCNLCKQFCDSVYFYSGHPNNSNEEFIALTDPKLSLFTGNEEIYNEEDAPTHQLTNFTVYDKNGHLCHFDSGLIEKNVSLYFSGYIKPVYDENPNADNGIPAHDLGPIDEWWMAGMDDVEGNIRVGFTTQFAQYYLMEPSAQYQPIFNKIKEKVRLSKYVIEFLSDHHWENPKYEDLVENIEGSGEYTDVEDTLLQHAQFICDQVLSFDENITEDEKPLIALPCMRALVSMAGVSFKSIKKIKPVNKIKKEKNTNMSKAVTTKLVHDIFEYFFPDQIDAKIVEKGPKKKRCGICEACQSPDCGECNHCRDMVKFGGPGKLKQACKRRRCMHMEVMYAEVSDNEDEKDVMCEFKHKKTKHLSTKIIHTVKWNDEIEEKYKGDTCYSSATVGDFMVQIGDYVMVKSKRQKEPSYIARITRMFYKSSNQYMFHGLLLCRGSDTILGETSDPKELFIIDDCENLLLGSIICKVKVIFRRIPDNWSSLGGVLSLEEQFEDDDKTFYFTKRFNNNRFEDLDFDPDINIGCCEACRREEVFQKMDSPTLVNNLITWKNEEYKVGTGVFLDPEVYTFYNFARFEERNETQVNVFLHPEYFRKKTENVKGSNDSTSDPFVIGVIEDIIETKSEDIKIEVRVFFRPEHTYISTTMAYNKDLNYLFYSDEVITVPFSKVEGKCYLSYGYNFKSIIEWSEQGPYRFYFTEAYDPENKIRKELCEKAKNIGIRGKGKADGKVKGNSKQENDFTDFPPIWDKIDRPLKCMDVFAGCGGLSEGLKISKIADSKWAIEKEVSAANAFKLNNPDCKVFIDDCNNLLKFIVNNETKEKGLPEKGEVEMIVGGPPCQGFSGMNRFKCGDYSSFKNSLVVSLLTFCEYYRPQYFILENVRNFVSFKKSMVLKLTLRCLLTMGYQVTFGILQAGQYGVPQTRRRLILMAAAPGKVLPNYPEPLHVFNKKATHLSFNVDGYSYYNECEWTDSAPYRTITVKDAISDLPAIKNGYSKTELPYDCDPETHYQRMLRSDNNTLVRDHVSKEMSPLVEARISHIPTYPGADWRDLPNVRVSMPDSTQTYLLRYPYRVKKTRGGVCQCVLGKPCDPSDRQIYTLIPWCLAHTADRHNHWAGLYGRLEWFGYFGTTITNPEPMGKQGRVLHPEQHRVVSVRECARSQGFPDKFRFCGNILDKYRQIGNAVPPPLGVAIGKEIIKAQRKNIINQRVVTMDVESTSCITNGLS
ncbi:DNA (cytosine-5)-methyltransferase PliMCI-like [Diabrotica undecimpunctata]|uniref:DNA (cytosine-5)-methyltransferase PliMCI-like n=1 Tax=Diabrotica undecimpunctata TaxID=50387 RepID=UPI003B636620